MESRGLSDNTTSSGSSRSGQVTRIREGIYSHLPSGAIPVQYCPGTGAPRTENRTVTPNALYVSVNPVTNLRGLTSGRNGEITIHPRRRGGTMVIGYEGFTCLLGSDGGKYITINFSISGMPYGKFTHLVPLRFAGEQMLGKIVVEGTGDCNTVPFKLYFDYKEEMVSRPNIHLEVDGGAFVYPIHEHN
jgi:hypothetical protein